MVALLSNLFCAYLPTSQGLCPQGAQEQVEGEFGRTDSKRQGALLPLFL